MSVSADLPERPFFHEVSSEIRSWLSGQPGDNAIPKVVEVGVDARIGTDGALGRAASAIISSAMLGALDFPPGGYVLVPRYNSPPDAEFDVTTVVVVRREPTARRATT